MIWDKKEKLTTHISNLNITYIEQKERDVDGSDTYTIFSKI